MNQYPLSAAQKLIMHTHQLATPNGSEPTPSLDSVYNIIEQLGCLQIDTLLMVERSHYMMLWSRLGNYEKALLDQLVYGPDRKCFEYWFHAACILPLSLYPYIALDMEGRRNKPRKRTQIWLKEEANQQIITDVLTRIEKEGALRGADFKGDGKKRGAWWDWKPAKLALEHLYNCGDLMIADRIKFQRAYDLKERVLPPEFSQVAANQEDYIRYTLLKAAELFGLCLPKHLQLYRFWNKGTITPILNQLLESGELQFVPVEGFDRATHQMIIHPKNLPLLQQAADGTLSATRTTFLNPFDSFWYPQGRDELLWGFWQRLEAYKPKGTYRYGYFSLPILHHHQLIGRFDPKVDRKTKTLHLKKLYLQPDIKLNDQMIASVKETFTDFMQFNGANELLIHHSDPPEFGAQLLR